MAALLTPRRRRGHEILDDAAVDAQVRERSLDDVARANLLFGGAGAVLGELRETLGRARGRELTLLDVGTGVADIPRRAAHEAERLGVRLTTIGLDAAECLAATARRRAGLVPVCGDALALPFADASVDVVTCSQLLHHFAEADALRVLGELDRVARARVIVADLRRSWLAAAGLWVASFPLRFHPISRHDGVVSVLRGFTADELRTAVRGATGHGAEVRRRIGFRLTASWTPGTAARAIA